MSTDGSQTNARKAAGVFENGDSEGPSAVIAKSFTKRQLDLMYGAVDKLLNEYNVIFKDRKILDDIRSEESMVDNIEHMLHERIFELDISLCEKVYYRTLICDLCQISDIIEDISDQIQVMLVERES